MKTELHPELKKTDVQCGCGNEFSIYSTLDELTVEICSDCHPFYTGQQKYVDSEGRVEKFQDKYDWSEERASMLAGTEEGADVEETDVEEEEEDQEEKQQAEEEDEEDTDE